MEKQSPVAKEQLSYYQTAIQLPTDAKNYLGRQITTLQGYGNSAYEYGAQKMEQISKFPARAKAFYNVIDQTAYTSYRGTMIGGLVGFFTGGIFGAYVGAQYGAALGAWIGLFNGINELADQIHAENSEVTAKEI